MLSLAKKEKGKGFSSHGAKPHTPFYRKSMDRERRAEHGRAFALWQIGSLTARRAESFCALPIEDRKPRAELKGFSFPAIEDVR